jgi:hypothetical protein
MRLERGYTSFTRAAHPTLGCPAWFAAATLVGAQSQIEWDGERYAIDREPPESSQRFPPYQTHRLSDYEALRTHFDKCCRVCSLDVVLGSRQFRIEKDIQLSDLALTNDDNIEPGVLGRLAFRARAPCNNSPVV